MTKPTFPDLYRVGIDQPQAQPLILQVTQRMCRVLWGSATAYRLGLLSRFTRLDNPYPPEHNLHDLFDKGSMQITQLHMTVLP